MTRNNITNEHVTFTAEWDTVSNCDDSIDIRITFTGDTPNAVVKVKNVWHNIFIDSPPESAVTESIANEWLCSKEQVKEMKENMENGEIRVSDMPDEIRESAESHINRVKNNDAVMTTTGLFFTQHVSLDVLTSNAKKIVNETDTALFIADPGSRWFNIINTDVSLKQVNNTLRNLGSGKMLGNIKLIPVNKHCVTDYNDTPLTVSYEYLDTINKLVDNTSMTTRMATAFTLRTINNVNDTEAARSMGVAERTMREHDNKATEKIRDNPGELFESISSDILEREHEAHGETALTGVLNIED